MNIHQFMLLPESKMNQCINQVIPSPNASIEAEYDVKVFTANELRGHYNDDPICEICQREYKNHSDIPLYSEYIGTSDTREPKYCFQHYVFINFWSEFLEPPIEQGECVSEEELLKEEMISKVLESPLYKAKGREWAVDQVERVLRNIDTDLTPSSVTIILGHEFGLYESIEQQKEHFDLMKSPNNASEEEKQKTLAFQFLKEAEHFLNTTPNFPLPDGRTSYEYLSRLSIFLKGFNH
jgi:hypothetical protein